MLHARGSPPRSPPRSPVRSGRWLQLHLVLGVLDEADVFLMQRRSRLHPVRRMIMMLHARGPPPQSPPRSTARWVTVWMQRVGSETQSMVPKKQNRSGPVSMLVYGHVVQ